MKQYCLFFVISFSSCVMDHVHDAQVSNASKHVIHILIQYDRGVLDNIYKGKSYDSYLRNIDGNPHGFLSGFDSINSISNYTIPPGRVLKIEHGMGKGPSFTIIQSITIFSPDSVKRVYLHGELGTVFKKIDTGEYELQIK
jgi:hypothetical protein